VKFVLGEQMNSRLKGILLVAALLAPALADSTKDRGITYVDATDGPKGNTVMADRPTGPVGKGVEWTTNGTDTDDHTWRKRTKLGLPESSKTVPAGGAFTMPVDVDNGTVYESTGNTNPGDDVPRLKTTVSDLPTDTYDVYVYFWSDQANSPWRIRAGLTDSEEPLPLFIAGKTPKGDPEPVLLAVDGANRKLYQVKLGQVKGTSISVFVEDAPDKGGINRTWYDGIGYAVVGTGK
jgi:hypothetical protein